MLGAADTKQSVTNLAYMEKLCGSWEEPSCEDVTVEGKTVSKEREKYDYESRIRI